MNGLVDSRYRSRNIGFTPFQSPPRADHVMIAVELDHEFSFENGRPPRNLRWLLTMDLDCFSNRQCSTVGFMSILAPDAEGHFRPLERQNGDDAWRVPELGNRVVWGMGYRVADFNLEKPDGNSKRGALKLKLKRERRRPLP